MGEIQRNFFSAVLLVAFGTLLSQPILAQVTCKSVFTEQLRTFPLKAVETEPSMTREEFYKAYATTLLSPTSQISLSSYARRKYINGDEIYATLMQIDYAMRVLIVDPGIVLRIKDFKSFTKKHPEFKSDPWQMRAAYSKFLGSEIVYRGISVAKNYQVPSNLLAKGFISDGYKSLLSPQFLNQSFENQVATHLLHNKMTPIEKREASELPDFIMSVSSHFLISRTVAVGAAKSHWSPYDNEPIQQDLLVFKMLIPKLDLSDIKNYPNHDGIYNFASDRVLKVLDYGKDEEGRRKPNFIFRDGVEKFVFGLISSQEILSVESQDFNANTQSIFWAEKGKENLYD